MKLESILRLKIMRNDWLLADMCPQAANHCALFESETVLKFYNLDAFLTIVLPKYVNVDYCTAKICQRRVSRSVHLYCQKVST